MKLFTRSLAVLSVMFTAYTPVALAEWEVVGGAIDISQGRQIYNRVEGNFVVTTKITNQSGSLMEGPLRLVISDNSHALLSQDGETSNGNPYHVIEQGLAAGATYTTNLKFAYARSLVTFNAHVEKDAQDTPPADTVAPSITLIGGASIQHEQGTTFTDPGATATDDVDGAVAVTVSGVVGASSGVYTLTYSASDAAGNEATVDRKVKVSDTQAPVITLTGASTIELQADETYTEPGATAYDQVDGNVPVEIAGDVQQESGEYTITYTATDLAGNSASTTRLVIVPEQDSTTELIVLRNGEVGEHWDRNLNAFDAAIGYANCSNDGGAGCPSINWQWVEDDDRGTVLEIEHGTNNQLAGFFIGSSDAVDISSFETGQLKFDIKVVSGDSNITFKLDCFYPCTSGDYPLGQKGTDGWETVSVDVAELKQRGLNLQQLDTGIVIWASQFAGTVFRLDNIHYVGNGDTPPPTPLPDDFEYNITQYGSGSISDAINPNSYRCVVDYGNWIYNAGVVEPAIAGCNPSTGIPAGTPTKRYPQVVGSAADKPTPTHKWWGSLSFLGEMQVGNPNDAAYITPDPITARITERGFRMMGIPSGLRTVGNNFTYQIPDPFSEVFDGLAVANSVYSNLDAYVSESSDGTVTVQWHNDADVPVMQATFVHGSPYIYLKAFEGDFVIRTLRGDGGEKGIFYEQDNSLGVWTSVAGNHNNYLITGEGQTEFEDVSTNAITVTNAAKEITVTWLPVVGAIPDTALTESFAAAARNVVSRVAIDYSVNRENNKVSVTHQYLDAADQPVNTFAGLQPLHWKNAGAVVSDYQVRSSRGITKYAYTSEFTYTLPYVGVLPSLPTVAQSINDSTLSNLLDEFLAIEQAAWNDKTDSYWAGKNYGKVAELIAIAQQSGWDEQATQMRDWLKGELANWFTAETNGVLDEVKYFVYDNDWNTLLALEESFSSHQQLNDHHFHYGYFIRAAAEICRVDKAWCSNAQYGPMIELLIRDFAAGKEDNMFPYVRNFDPANGFSWASGSVNFVRGNNNESTSEAANAYGAIVLYGLITGNTELVERGMYLHASTTAAYWEYWNNIDGYMETGADEDNFPSDYPYITTSIIWGDGAVFSTWFSGAYAHILGIQGLPTNPLILHVGLYSDYMEDYVDLGLTESSNGLPSGLIPDQWRDIWWNLMAMTNPARAIQDYNSVESYIPEAGETKAHTYHWIHTLNALGQVATGTGELTADHPSAMAFVKDGVTTYVVYNFSDEPVLVTYSDGKQVTALPNQFTVQQ